MIYINFIQGNSSSQYMEFRSSTVGGLSVWTVAIHGSDRRSSHCEGTGQAEFTTAVSYDASIAQRSLVSFVDIHYMK